MEAADGAGGAGGGNSPANGGPAAAEASADAADAPHAGKAGSAEQVLARAPVSAAFAYGTGGTHEEHAEVDDDSDAEELEALLAEEDARVVRERARAGEGGSVLTAPFAQRGDGTRTRQERIVLRTIELSHGTSYDNAELEAEVDAALEGLVRRTEATGSASGGTSPTRAGTGAGSSRGVSVDVGVDGALDALVDELAVDHVEAVHSVADQSAAVVEVAGEPDELERIEESEQAVDVFLRGEGESSGEACSSPMHDDAYAAGASSCEESAEAEADAQTSAGDHVAVQELWPSSEGARAELESKAIQVDTMGVDVSDYSSSSLSTPTSVDTERTRKTEAAPERVVVTVASTEEALLGALRASSIARQRQETADWEAFRGALSAAERRVEAAKAAVEEERARAKREAGAADSERTQLLEKLAAAVARADAAERRVTELERERHAWEDQRTRLQAELRASAYNVATAMTPAGGVGAHEARVQRLEDRIYAQPHALPPPWIIHFGDVRPATAPGTSPPSSSHEHAHARSGMGAQGGANAPDHSLPMPEAPPPAQYRPATAGGYTYAFRPDYGRWDGLLSSRSALSGAAAGRFWPSTHSAQMEELEARAMRRSRARRSARELAASAAAQEARARAVASAAAAARAEALGAVGAPYRAKGDGEEVKGAEADEAERMAGATAAEAAWQRREAVEAQARVRVEVRACSQEDEERARAKLAAQIERENAHFVPKRGAFRGWKVQQREDRRAYDGRLAAVPSLKRALAPDARTTERAHGGDERGLSSYERELEGIRMQYHAQKLEMGRRQREAALQQPPVQQLLHLQPQAQQAQ